MFRKVCRRRKFVLELWLRVFAPELKTTCAIPWWDLLFWLSHVTLHNSKFLICVFWWLQIVFDDSQIESYLLRFVHSAKWFQHQLWMRGFAYSILHIWLLNVYSHHFNLAFSNSNVPPSAPFNDTWSWLYLSWFILSRALHPSSLRGFCRAGSNWYAWTSVHMMFEL